MAALTASDKALAFFSNIPAVSEALAEHAVVPAERSFASSLWRLLQEEVDAAAGVGSHSLSSEAFSVCGL